MKVLVTGPDGLLGSNLVRELLNRGYAVTAMTQTSQTPETLSGLAIQLKTGDLLDDLRIHEIVAGMDVVIHCAANTCTYPARAEIINKVNIDGTKNVVDACLKHQVKRLIVVGSANSFSPGSIDHPGTENAPYAGYQYGLDYMDSKYVAKELVLDAVEKSGLNAVIVCPTFMIGPYDSRPSSGALILGLYNKKIPGYTKGGKNYVAVKDVAVGIANAIEKGRKGECYILGNTNLTYLEFFQKIETAIAIRRPRLKLNGRLVILFGWINSKLAGILRYKPALTYELARLSAGDHYYSAQKAVRELDLPQTPIENALKECFDWFGTNGYLTKK